MPVTDILRVFIYKLLFCEVALLVYLELVLEHRQGEECGDEGAPGRPARTREPGTEEPRVLHRLERGQHEAGPGSPPTPPSPTVWLPPTVGESD